MSNYSISIIEPYPIQKVYIMQYQESKTQLNQKPNYTKNLTCSLLKRLVLSSFHEKNCKTLTLDNFFLSDANFTSVFRPIVNTFQED